MTAQTATAGLPESAPLTLVQRLRNTPNWRRESYGHWKDMTSEYDRSPFEAADEIERLNAELDRRKGDPRTRLHNICEAIAEEADGSEFSREEWERIDKENAALRASNAAMRAVLETIVRVADGRTISGNLILDENSPIMGAARAALAGSAE